MLRRISLLALFLLLVPGCQWFRSTSTDQEILDGQPVEIPEPKARFFHRPGSSGKVYSLNPRAQEVERNLGFRR